ncbi:TrkA-N domain protein (fragment) [Candidatus Desulfarcum epimagneticum]|uniref:TrkA-N domain protein n=1 Tax=uncultured Desulfobacteraceae bacterium TaxID=218296 RepID=A0A484HJ45_9BACT
MSIISRAGDHRAKSKLLAAGADFVDSPYETGGRRMAQRALNPNLTNFLDLVFEWKRHDIEMEEITATESSKITGLKLKESGVRVNFNVIVIAMQREDGTMIFNPSSENRIMPGDTVIVMGKTKDLEKMAEVLNPEGEKTGGRP